MASDVSVVICAYTFERWDTLVKAVRSMQNQTEPPLEIIVVIDHNPALLTRVETEMPEVIAVANRGRQGLSGARNTGVETAVGQKITFLDDDAAAQPNLLKQLSGWCDQPDVMGAGGKVVPDWESEKPGWFPEEFFWVFGCSYLGMPETATPVRNIFGGVMCLRREIFEAVGGFHEGIGRVGTIPLGCEETELCIRTRQHWTNSKIMYEPKAIASHFVPEKRTRWQYFRDRCYAEGVSKALVSSLVGSNDALATERTHTMRTLPRGVLRGINDTLLRGDRSGLLRAVAIIGGLVAAAAGYGVQSIRLWSPVRRRQWTSSVRDIS